MSPGRRYGDSGGGGCHWETHYYSCNCVTICDRYSELEVKEALPAHGGVFSFAVLVYTCVLVLCRCPC